MPPHRTHRPSRSGKPWLYFPPFHPFGNQSTLIHPTSPSMKSPLSSAPMPDKAADIEPLQADGQDQASRDDLRPARFSKPRRSSHGQEERRKQNARPIADRIVHIPCPIRRQILNPFQADGQGQAGRDDPPEGMPWKSEAPERGQGHKHQGVQEVIEAEVDYGGVGQGGVEAANGRGCQQKQGWQIQEQECFTYHGLRFTSTFLTPFLTFCHTSSFTHGRVRSCHRCGCTVIIIWSGRAP